ncbi:acyl-homoserine-lactone synthase [Burkholderia alba]|uniref:acyl-homoserine-lactone synthase n=1 Tax=Burkholderia alba TaxID=2683677 RepID=UPI002B05197E|nr:acyl-homoserine-lactone synthase [Burkholderia alba]
MMFDVLSGNSAALGRSTMRQLRGYRHKMLYREPDRPLPALDEPGHDEFDHDETLYVVAIDQRGDVTGCGRLLPTSRPYLLGTHFAHLMSPALPPADNDVWELSCFAIGLPRGESMGEEDVRRPALLLVDEIVRVARTQGADRLITFSSLGVVRLLQRTGIDIHRAAPPQWMNDTPTLPCWIDIDRHAGAAHARDPGPRRTGTLRRADLPSANRPACRLSGVM